MFFLFIIIEKGFLPNGKNLFFVKCFYLFMIQSVQELCNSGNKKIKTVNLFTKIIIFEYNDTKLHKT